MQIELSKSDIRAIAKEVVRLLQAEPPERLLTAREAADALGISTGYLYKIKDRLPYVKSGDNRQSSLRFRERGLREAYMRQRETVS